MSLHEERLHGLLYRLKLAATVDKEGSTFARSSPTKPPALVAFQAGRDQAAAALLAIGALPPAARLAEEMHDYKTLSLLCTRPPPALPPQLLRGRRVVSGVELRHELLARLVPPPPPLYDHEERAQPPFVDELCLACYELGSLGCRELLRLPEDYPFLAPHLRAFLATYPRLYWLHLVDEAAHTTDPAQSTTSLEEAARALYGWGLQTGAGVTPVSK